MHEFTSIFKIIVFQIVGDVTKENTLDPEYFKGIKKVINAVSVIVGPREGDTPDRAKYSQVGQICMCMYFYDFDEDNLLTKLSSLYFIITCNVIRVYFEIRFPELYNGFFVGHRESNFSSLRWLNNLPPILFCKQSLILKWMVLHLKFCNVIYFSCS